MIRTSDKIKGVLAFHGCPLAQYAAKLKIQSPALSIKLKNNTFTLKDIIVLAELLECDLCLVNKNNDVVVNFSNND